MDTQQEIALRSCAQCGCESPSDALFCIECGESLGSHTGPTTYLRGPMCSQCGHEELPGARFCRLCGQQIAMESMAGQPWAVSTSASPPHLHQHQSASAARPQLAVPQLTLPPAPFVPTTTPSSSARIDFSAAGLLMLIGVAFLLFTKLFTWPLFLLLLGAVYVVTELQKGRTTQALTLVACLGVAALFWTQPRLLLSLGRMWPLIFIFFFFFKKSKRP